MIEIRVNNIKRLTNAGASLKAVARGKYSHDAVKYGAGYARAVMPKDTGALFRALQEVYGKQSAKLILNLPRHRDGRKRPYHMWMAGYRVPATGVGAGAGSGYDLSNGFRHHITGRMTYFDGEPRFMEKAMIEMRKYINDKVTDDLKKV